MTKILLPIFLLSGVLTLLYFQSSKLPCANTGTCANTLESVVENDAVGTFLGQTVAAPHIDENVSITPVLGVETEEKPKHIYVDLEKQTLYAYDGNELFLQTLVSTGRWGRTPPGNYKIWIKIRSTRMSGGSGSDYYNLPNVPYTMFFYSDKVPKDRGYALHGAYWHNNFGHEMSHGCVNLRIIDAKALYEWALPVSTASTTHATADNPGTEISICPRMQINEGSTPTCLE